MKEQKVVVEKGLGSFELSLNRDLRDGWQIITESVRIVLSHGESLSGYQERYFAILERDKQS
jgi:hypothetical protein